MLQNCITELWGAWSSYAVVLCILAMQQWCGARLSRVYNKYIQLIMLSRITCIPFFSFKLPFHQLIASHLLSTADLWKRNSLLQFTFRHITLWTVKYEWIDVVDHLARETAKPALWSIVWSIFSAKVTIEQGALLGASASILAGFASTGSKYSENYAIHRTYSLTFIFGYRVASIVV